MEVAALLMAHEIENAALERDMKLYINEGGCCTPHMQLWL
jgi:hypothetical protein